jgi:acetyltransferase-like isoleucine patch superfamily enzyme
MKEHHKTSIKEKLDFWFFGWIINIAYPQYYRPKYGYQKYAKLFFHFLIPQKVFRINGSVKWPVHYTSKVIDAHKISKGILCDPGDNIGNYIQATNGIVFGNNIELGPGVKIISANHKTSDFTKHSIGKPIEIGNNVWIGANAIILPEVKIGNNVIIGAGSVVTKSIPSNSIAFGNPCKVQKTKKEYNFDISKIVLNKKLKIVL